MYAGAQSVRRDKRITAPCDGIRNPSRAAPLVKKKPER
jgi:hypothetical protein